MSCSVEAVASFVISLCLGLIAFLLLWGVWFGVRGILALYSLAHEALRRWVSR
jgi:hypothetical protein